MNRLQAVIAIFLTAMPNLVSAPAIATPFEVVATVETEPVPSGEDAADDPCIWVHPSDGAQSLVLGTDKAGGLAVYDLTGRMLQYLPEGKFNNVDIRYGFPLGKTSVDLVVTCDRQGESLVIYRVDERLRRLENISARRIPTGIAPYGCCMYRSAKSGKYYTFVTSKEGSLQQWELFETEGRIDARLVRRLEVGSQTEGCVADDETGMLYVAEEGVAIWKYWAEPDRDSNRTAVDSIGGAGHLVPDIEGLALYRGVGGTGYLVASSQGDSSFVIYRREGENEFVGSFRLIGGADIDAVSGTDGIEVTSANLGPEFPEGLFIAQDDHNDGANQNFKLVPWGAVARSIVPRLTLNVDYDPRKH